LLDDFLFYKEHFSQENCRPAIIRHELIVLLDNYFDMRKNSIGTPFSISCESMNYAAIRKVR